MRQRTLKIIVVFGFFILPDYLHAQNVFSRAADSGIVQPKNNVEKFWMQFSPIQAKNATSPFFNYHFEGKHFSFRSISSDYMQQLGLFCRQEWKLDQLTPIKFRFRLGSQNYVDRLEGKPNAAWFR